MHAGLEDVVAVRQEILELLLLQMEALDSPEGLTDAQLRECYIRRNRVQELREKLQAASKLKREIGSTATTAQGFSPSADVAATA
jgi:hypothetical protein